MDSLALLATILIAGAVSALAVIYVVRPLLAPGPSEMVLEDDKLSDLIWRKDAALKAIKDLEFDYKVGKVSEEDFQQVDQRLRRQAIVLIQQLDKLAPSSSTLDDQLEAAIAAMRKTSARPAAPVAASVSAQVPAQLDDELEAAIAAMRKASAPPAAPAGAAQPVQAGPTPRFCTNCGHVVEPSHKFCANCGTPVAVPALVSGDGAAV